MYQRCMNPWICTTDFMNAVRTQLRTTLAFNIVQINVVQINVVQINSVQGNVGTALLPHTMLYKSNGVRGNVV